MTLAPKRPAGWATWDRRADLYQDGRTIERWTRGRLLVCSSIQIAEFRGEERWQWLVSVSAGGHRATDDEVSKALKAFDMANAEEDNHFPGRARSFFRLCDARPEDPAECECKEGETTVVEADGFRWQRTADPVEFDQVAALNMRLGNGPVSR